MTRLLILWLCFTLFLILVNFPFLRVYDIKFAILFSSCGTLGMFLAVFVDTAVAFLSRIDKDK